MSSEPNTDPDAAKGFGHDLAALLAAAQRDGGLVVRTAPVFKLGSFLEETADMRGYAPVLTDTLTVLHFLAHSGKIDESTRSTAQAYLKQVDAGWQPAAPIDATAVLYLDDLAVTYLDHVGVLDVLTKSIAAAFVNEELSKRTRELIRHGKQVQALLGAIERIRATINAKVEAGSVGAANLSRIRSPITSRSNWAKERRMLSVSRPIEVVVLKAAAQSGMPPRSNAKHRGFIPYTLIFERTLSGTM